MYLAKNCLGILFLLLILWNVSNVEAATYRDCTEEIKQYVLNKNNGTLQFEYTHYSGFWLSQSLDDHEKLLLQQKTILAKQRKDPEEGTSFVTILDSKTFSSLAQLQKRYVGYLWSWTIRGK